MDISTSVYIIVFLAHLVTASIAFAIFTSIYLKNRRKGLVSLTIIFSLLGNSLYHGFIASNIMGIGMMIIFACLSIFTYINLQKKIKKEVTQ
ncbi:hypothetical protein B4U37_16675 [Sutcliffiella horikoshii]|uniref:Uncharacterized protein n=1 Tax=Sutcliffiella horikoshii TaxID=79883 RepID=A0ABM6KMA1_9BACI|nr:hypothetical protein B4U37_16675 [Sutcliffiella horikoshii]